MSGNNGKRDPAWLEFYKTTLDHREKLVSIIFASGIAVAIPAAVDVYKAIIDKDTKDSQVKIEGILKQREADQRDADQSLKKLEFREKTIESFSSTGLQQDIELRIRLAEYFSALSDDDYKGKWSDYRDILVKRREDFKTKLDNLNDQLDAEAIKTDPDQLKLRKLTRAKRWLEAEFNPVEQSETVTLKASNSQPFSNEGLDTIDLDTLVKMIGSPLKEGEQPRTSCSEPTNPQFTTLLKHETLAVGEVTLLAPAIESLKQILDTIAKRDPDLLKSMTSAGGLCVRFQRNTTRMSRHAFGLAIDITLDGRIPLFDQDDGAEAALRTRYRVIAEEFHKAGWLWGGAWNLPADIPHFEVSQQLFDKWVENKSLITAK